MNESKLYENIPSSAGKYINGEFCLDPQGTGIMIGNAVFYTAGGYVAGLSIINEKLVIFRKILEVTLQEESGSERLEAHYSKARDAAMKRFSELWEGKTA